MESTVRVVPVVLGRELGNRKMCLCCFFFAENQGHLFVV